MRLLNTTTLRVEQAKKEIVANEKPPFEYAILSHTWGEDEVIFQDMQVNVPRHNPRFSKIVRSCELAKKDGYDYIWLDTCCIDKSSSAELSEAINSMYLWYSQAAICYAYLSDVVALDPSSFRKSRWFTRGWTLQELIAPGHMVFLSKDWNHLGDKQDLLGLLSDITSINHNVLLDGNRRSDISIARKMSWAAKRTTTRVEDRAYSLLGIFDVNMPLLYGEGWKAFTRLQEEILKKSDDESLFANYRPLYQDHTDDSLYQTIETGPLLAETLDYFLSSADVLLHDKDWRLHNAPEQGTEAFSLVTNKGLQVPSFGCPCIYKPRSKHSRSIYGWLMILDCRMQDDIFARPAVFLKPLSLGDDRYTRFNPYTLLIVRRIDGEVTLKNWRDRSGRYPSVSPVDRILFHPEFDKLQRRTIYVEGGDRRLRNDNQPCVWLRAIAQPENSRFGVVHGSTGWDERQQCLLGTVDFVRGQLMFRDLVLGDVFMVVVYLEYLSRYENRGLGSKHPLAYRIWCKLFQPPLHEELKSLPPKPPLPGAAASARGIFSSSIFPNFGGYIHEIQAKSLDNKEYITTLVIADRVNVQAKLGLEEFLGRKEFILTINIRAGSDKEGERQKQKQEEAREERESKKGVNKRVTFAMVNDVYR